MMRGSSRPVPKLGPLEIADKSVPWCINTGKSLIPLTLRFLAQKRNLLIPLELSRVMHQGTIFVPILPFFDVVTFYISNG